MLAKNIPERATAGDRNVTMFTLPGLAADQSQGEAGSERPMRGESEHNMEPAARHQRHLAGQLSTGPELCKQKNLQHEHRAQSTRSSFSVNPTFLERN